MQSPEMRVPIALRSLGHRLGSVQPLKALGKSLYSRISRYCAQRLSRLDGVHAVSLRGGTLQRCIPAISDLDFSVDISGMQRLSDEERLFEALCRVYVDLKKTFWIMGEVCLVRKEDWILFQRLSPGSILPYVEQRRFYQEKWVDGTVLPLRTIGSESRFAFCLSHYARALFYLQQAQALGHRNYFIAHFRREVSKAIDLTSGTSVSLHYDKSEVLLAWAFKKLHRLAIEEDATSAHSESYPEVELIPSAADSDIALRLLSDHWLSKFRKSNGDGFRLSAVKAPFVFVLGRPLDSASLEGFFGHYQDYLDANGIRAGGVRPVFLTREMYECYQSGWFWGRPFRNLSWIEIKGPGDPTHRKSLAISMVRSLLERTVTWLNLLPGQMVSQTPRTIQENLIDFSAETLSLATGLVTADMGALIRRARTQWPISSGLLAQLLGSDRPYERHRLFALFLEIRNEMRPVLENLVNRVLVNLC